MIDFTEKDFNRCVEELRTLLYQKGREYNKVSNIYDYFWYKPESFNTMLYIKILREINKTDFTDSDNFDSLKDLILYAMFKWNYYYYYYKKKNNEVAHEE